MRREVTQMHVHTGWMQTVFALASSTTRPERECKREDQRLPPTLRRAMRIAGAAAGSTAPTAPSAAVRGRFMM